MSNTTFVKNQIKNYHVSQKWMWTVLAGFALFRATMVLMVDVEHFIDGCYSDFRTFLLGTPAFYLVFLTIIYRFFVGDSRILDYYYDSLPEAFAEGVDRFHQYVHTLKPHILLLDGVVRVVQYLLFVAAANNLNDPVMFVWIIGGLLFINAIFSMAVILVLDPMDKFRNQLIVDELGHALPFLKYRTIWLYNNLLGSTLLFVLMVLWNPDFRLIMVLIVLILNSLIDIAGCKKVYLPSFKDFINR